MEIGFPSYANIAYIMRGEEFIIPKGNVILKPRDTLVIACSKRDEKELTKYLTQRASAKDLQKNIASQIEKSLSKIKEKDPQEEGNKPLEKEAPAEEMKKEATKPSKNKKKPAK